MGDGSELRGRQSPSSAPARPPSGSPASPTRRPWPPRRCPRWPTSPPGTGPASPRPSSSNGATTWSTACRSRRAVRTPGRTRWRSTCRGRPSPPSTRADPAPFAADDPALLAPLSTRSPRLLPSLDPRPVATERCVYDNSSDADFVLDRVGRVVVGCGTSGHAFKFGPLLGELLADLAEGARPAVDLSRFSVNRRVTSAPGSPPESR